MDKRFKQYLALLMSVLLVFSTFEFSSIALDSVGDANTKAASVEEESDPPSSDQTPSTQTPSAPANDNDGGSDAAAPAGGGETETPAVTEEPAAENVEKAPADAGTDEGSQFRAQEADDPDEDNGEGDIPEEEANKIPGEPSAVGGLTYSGSAQELVTRGEPVTVKGRTYYWMTRISGDSDWHRSIPTATEAGTYVVEYKLSRHKSWKGFRYGTVEVTIDPARLSVEWNDQSVFVYNGEKQSPAYTLYGIQGGNVPYLTYHFTGSGGYDSDESPTEVGRYTMSVALPDSESNYIMKSSSKKFTIVEAKDEPEGIDRVYDGHHHYLTSFVKGYMYSMSPDGPFSYKRPVRKNAGEYTVYYRYGRKGEVKAITVTISPAELELVWDEETEFAYDGEPHSPGYTLSGVIGKDDPEIALAYAGRGAALEGEPSEPGRYIVKASLAENEGNYTMEASSKKFSIVEEREEPTGNYVTYNGHGQYLVTAVEGYMYSMSPDGPFSYKRPARKNAGEYTVYYRYGRKGEVSETAAEILMADLKLIWDDETTFDYDGEPHSPGYTLEGVMDGDDPQITIHYFSEKGLEIEEPSEPGTYTASASASERNYFLNGDDVSFTILEEPQPEPTEKPESVEVEYDGHGHYLSTYVKGYMYSLSPDKGFSYRRPVRKNVGGYTVYYKYGEDGEVESFLSAISPKALEVNWEPPFEFDEDGDAHAPEATLSGTVRGDRTPGYSYRYFSDKGLEVEKPSAAGSYTAQVVLDEGTRNYTLDEDSASQSFSITGEEPGPEPGPTDEPQAIDRTYDGSRQPLVTRVSGYRYSLSPNGNFSRFRPRATDAGVYVVFYKQGRNGEVKATTVIITPAELTLTWEPPFEFDYDGEPHTPGYTLDGVIDGDDPEIVFSYTEGIRAASDEASGAPVEAGDYNVSASLAEGETNYTMQTASTNFSIIGEEPGPEPPVADEPQAIDRTYDGSRQPLVTRVSGYRYSLSPDGSFSRFRPRATDAGEYTVYYRYGRNGTVKSVDVTIAPAALNLIWDEESLFDYDGAPHSPDYTLDGVMDGDDPEILVTYEGGNYKSPDAPTEVGDYTATAELSPDETNYTMESAGTSFSITGEGPEPGPVRAEPQPRNRTYDGSRQPLVTYVRGYRYSLSPDGDFSLIRPRATDAGEYTVYYKYGRSGNVKPVKVVISPAEISLKWDDETEFNYDGKPHAPGYTLEGVAASDDPEILVTYEGGNYKSPEAPTEKGEYTASAELSPNETNYTMQSSSTEFSIVDGGPEPGPVPAGPEAIDRTYDGSTQPLVTRADGYRYSLSPDGDFSRFRPRAKDAGEYTVYFRYGDSEETGSVKVTVAKRPLTAEWIDPFEFEYDGDGHAPTARLRGRAYGDRTPDFTYRYLDQDGTVLTDRPVNANTKGNSYTAEVVLAEDVNNYVLDPETASHKFIIYPKKIGFEWSDLEFTYDGEAHAPAATATGVIAGETLDIPVTVKDGPAVDAGDYTARVGDLDDPNYEYPADADPETRFTIKPAEIIVKANDQDICYGDPAPALMPVTDEEVEITGLPEKGVAFNYNELLLNTPYRQGDDAGSYPIEVKKALQVVDGGQAVNDIASLNPNYIIKEYINGTLRVKHIPDVVPPEPVIYVYDGTDKTLAKPGSAGEGFVIEYACGKEKPAADSPDWSTEINMATNAGDYTMWWRPVRKKLQGNGLMSMQDQEKDYDHGGSFISRILPRPVDISWEPLLFKYDGEIHIPTPSVTNLVKDDECVVLADGAASAAGKHTASAIGLSNRNYTLDGATGIYAEYEIVKDKDVDPSGSDSDSSDSSDSSGSSGSSSGTGVSSTGTGDSSHVIAWICSLILAAAAAAGLVLRRKSRDNSK